MVLNEQVPVVFTVNGDRYEILIEADWTLVDVLREKLGLTGTKTMCGEGDCGSCTVLIAGKPVLSCLTLAIECEGKDILTIEGLADAETGKLHPIQETFVEGSGMQCGICTSGVILTAKSLLDENSNPTEDEVRDALAGNLCRCGNYKSITGCVMAAAEILGGTSNV